LEEVGRHVRYERVDKATGAAVFRITEIIEAAPGRREEERFD
jgi:hypothetical protein